MPVKTYTKPATKKTSTKKHQIQQDAKTKKGQKNSSNSTDSGRSQALSSVKGLQHTNFDVAYAKTMPDVDLFKQEFKIIARSSEGTYDLSGLVENLQWQDQSADVLTLVNTEIPLTGSIGLRKPALSEYKRLVPPFLDASLDKSRHGVSRWGALGVSIICSVGYGKAFIPLWVMRVVGGQSGAAEQVNLEDGTWTLQLADDLAQLSASVDDFKFTQGKKAKQKGFRAHEITYQVCKQYGIPIKQLVRGTSYMELKSTDTTAVSPMTVISAAYDHEQGITGKSFVIRWAAPDKKHPLGALEVVPWRRNPNLLRFREQLVNAALTRSTSPDFATVITARATLKGATGKHKQITYIAKNAQGVRRFGYVHKIIDYKTVNSHLELEILAKRALAYRLTPLRGVELTHPGVSTIRRGDAIQIDLPEEGYADVSLAVFTKPPDPTPPKHKKKLTASAQALQDAELIDPSLFGIPDASALSVQGQAASSTGAVAWSGPMGAGRSGTYRALVDDNLAFAGVDQGIDFTGGPGHVYALANGVVTRLVPSGSGWPGSPGSLIAYRMTSGSRSGQYCYVAEDFDIAGGLHVGSVITAGQSIGVANGRGVAPGIECGFADSGGHAIAHAPSSGPTGPGRDFDAFVRAGGGGGGTTAAATTAASKTAKVAAATTQSITADVPVVMPIANQGIAFVTSVTHSVSSGAYSMDLVASFVDVLDPLALKAEMEANIRNFKAAQAAANPTPAKTGSGTGAAATGATGTGTRWNVPVGWENDSPLGGACSGGACAAGGNVPADGLCFSVCSVSGTPGDVGTAGQALTPGSRWPNSAKLIITNPNNNKSFTGVLCDIGAGSGSFHPVINLYGTSGSGGLAALGLSGGPPWNLIVQAAPGAPTLHPARGHRV